MAKVSTRTRAHKPTRLPNYYRLLSGEIDRQHPIDALVDQHLHDRALAKRIIRLQDDIKQKLGEAKPLLELEQIQGRRERDREQAYFNIGYDLGLADRLARQRRGGAALAPEAERFASETRERLVQEGLAPRDVLLGLLECVWVVVTRSAEAPQAVAP